MLVGERPLNEWPGIDATGLVRLRAKRAPAKPRLNRVRRKISSCAPCYAISRLKPPNLRPGSFQRGLVVKALHIGEYPVRHQLFAHSLPTPRSAYSLCATAATMAAARGRSSQAERLTPYSCSASADWPPDQYTHIAAVACNS